jgi:four helix bundle protein
MGISGTHRDLAVWKRAIALAGKVYAATRALPSDEQFALQQQLRGAALAVPVNIAAACMSCNRAERIRHLQRARAALCEMETRLIVAMDQSVLAQSDAPVGEIAEVARLLGAFMHGVATARLAAHAKACAGGIAARPGSSYLAVVKKPACGPR